MLSDYLRDDLLKTKDEIKKLEKEDDD